MKRQLLTLFIGLFVGGLALPAQTMAQQNAEFLRKSVELQVGGIFPGGDISEDFGPAVVVGGSFGYRIMRNVQLDGGLDVAFGAARADRQIQLVTGGVRKVTDYEVFLPLGAICPAHQDPDLSYQEG